MKRVLLIPFLITILLLPYLEAKASIKDGEATITVDAVTTVSIGDAYQRTLDKAKSIDYNWSVSDAQGISITSKNRDAATIKGLKAGSYKLYYYCSYTYDGYFRTMDFYYDIIVNEKGPTSVTISPSALSLFVGTKTTLQAILQGGTGTCTWRSSNTNVATVSASGLSCELTAKSSGSCIITCTTNNGKSSTCNVTVKNPILVTAINLANTEANISVGQTLQLNASILPTNASIQTLKWTSSNNSVATVSASGLVTAIATGNCIITATSTDGGNVSATCSIKVTGTGYTKTISLDPTELSLVATESTTIKDIRQYNIDNKMKIAILNLQYPLEWNSSNPAVATISSGFVTAIAKGTTLITASTTDGSNLTAQCIVTVEDPETITLDENDIDTPEYNNVVNVIVKRNIHENEWSTLVLPFSMDSEQVKTAFGEDVQLATFTGWTSEKDSDDEIMSIVVEFQTVDKIETNHPLLIKTQRNIEDFMVEKVKIIADSSPAIVIENDKNEIGKLIGNYISGTIIPTDNLFISGNNFWYSKGKTKIKGFRAYFELPDVLTTQSDSQSKVSICFDQKTLVDGICEEPVPSGYYYSIDGVCHGNDYHQLSKGLYIINGKKVYKRN